MVLHRIDLTVDPLPRVRGGLHPTSVLLWEVVEALGRHGFDPVHGPQLESVEWNFDRLDIPLDHPMRGRGKNFWYDDDHVMRSQTSAGVARALMDAPGCSQVRRYLAGPCFRDEARSTRSARQFVQMDVLLAGPDVRLGHLRSLVGICLDALLGAGWPTRWRWGAAGATAALLVDARCSCHPAERDDCGVCQGTGWLELISGSELGAGLLRRCGHDPAGTRAVAFGLSVDRVVLLRCGLGNIGALLAGDGAVVAALRCR